MVIIFGPVEHDGAAFKGVGVFWIRQIALPELFRDHARFHDRGVEQISRQHLEAGVLFQRLVVRADHVGVLNLGLLDVFADGLAVDRARLRMDAAGRDQLMQHRRQSAGAVIFLAEIFAGGLHVDQQRHLMADRFPIVDRERHADVARDGVDVDRCVAGAADRRARDNGVLERVAGEDVGGFEILVHDLDRAPAGLVGDLCTLAVGRGDGGAARQRKAERLGERIHGRGRAHGVAVTDRWRRRRDEIEKFLVVHATGGMLLARPPHHGAGPRALALPPAVEHRPAGQHDRWRVHGRGRHDRRRCRLVTAGGEHDAVERIAEQHLDQAEIGEIAVERRGRTLAGFLDRMHRELEGDAAGVVDAFAHALGELEMVAIAGREVGPALGDAHDRLAGGELLLGQPVIEVALEIKRGHARIVGIVEPQLRAQPPLSIARHGRASGVPCPADLYRTIGRVRPRRCSRCAEIKSKRMVHGTAAAHPRMLI